MKTNDVTIGHYYLTKGVNGMAGRVVKVVDVTFHDAHCEDHTTKQRIKIKCRSLKRKAIQGIDY